MGAMTTTSVHVHGWDLIFLTAALLMARVFKPDLLWWAAVVNRGVDPMLGLRSFDAVWHALAIAEAPPLLVLCRRCAELQRIRRDFVYA
mmetsp:Transcript_153588/g.491077  ORF Transcript_153588/g.491077 Transcript_153588/m.491077 type:complete len:89 (-) Transcript_153588:14-280(-)